MEPGDGWKGGGPVGISADGGSPSWWADQPTLSSFAWTHPNAQLLRGDCLPGELPRELHRVIDGLHFHNSVEDFGLRQVSRIDQLYPEACARVRPGGECRVIFRTLNCCTSRGSFTVHGKTKLQNCACRSIGT